MFKECIGFHYLKNYHKFKGGKGEKIGNAFFKIKAVSFNF